MPSVVRRGVVEISKGKQRREGGKAKTAESVLVESVRESNCS